MAAQSPTLRVADSNRVRVPIRPRGVARLTPASVAHRSADPAKSISEIAYTAGFADSNYFSRRFREIYGTPPSVYRRNMFESVG